MIRFVTVFLAFSKSRLPYLRPSQQRTRTSLCSSSSDKNSFDLAELASRIESVKASEAQEVQNDRYLSLPVLCMDALLPGQKLTGRTSDRMFGQLLKEIGLGGLFVMTSLNHRARKLRRNGCIARIEICDAKKSFSSQNDGNNDNDDDDTKDEDDPTRIPTAVDFFIVGRKRCRVVGPASGLKLRAGRWRRSYDPDGEESVLGWGEEGFLDAVVEQACSDGILPVPTENIPFTEWTLTKVDSALEDPDVGDPAVLEKAESLVPLLEQWVELAGNSVTYTDTNVVASARVMKGQPGLRVDPAALLRNVIKGLGERPTDPTELAFWGAALVNPLPPLGVSPEIRGRVLEAPNAMSRLNILEWGIQRSLENLEGTRPL